MLKALQWKKFLIFMSLHVIYHLIILLSSASIIISAAVERRATSNTRPDLLNPLYVAVHLYSIISFPYLWPNFIVQNEYYMIILSSVLWTRQDYIYFAICNNFFYEFCSDCPPLRVIGSSVAFVSGYRKIKVLSIRIALEGRLSGPFLSFHKTAVRFSYVLENYEPKNNKTNCGDLATYINMRTTWKLRTDKSLKLYNQELKLLAGN